MAKTYTYLVRIPSGVYNPSSSTYGLNGGENTVDVVATNYIEVSGTFLNFYPTCRIKLVEGSIEEYLIVSTVEAGGTGDLKLTFTTDIQGSFTTSALCYIESYFGLAYNTTSIVDVDEGYFYSDLLINFSEIERAFIENCERGGTTQAEVGGNLAIVNTNQLSLYCEENDIFLHNCPVHVLLKVNTASDTYTIYNLGIYTITELSWNTTSYNISFNSTKNKRVSNLTSKLNSQDYPTIDEELAGETIPVVFGKNYTNGQYTKFLRTNSEEIL